MSSNDIWRYRLAKKEIYKEPFLRKKPMIAEFDVNEEELKEKNSGNCMTEVNMSTIRRTSQKD